MDAFFLFSALQDIMAVAKNCTTCAVITAAVDRTENLLSPFPRLSPKSPYPRTSPAARRAPEDTLGRGARGREVTQRCCASCETKYILRFAIPASRYTNFFGLIGHLLQHLPYNESECAFAVTQASLSLWKPPAMLRKIRKLRKSCA